MKREGPEYEAARAAGLAVYTGYVDRFDKLVEDLNADTALLPSHRLSLFHHMKRVVRGHDHMAMVEFNRSEDDDAIR